MESLILSTVVLFVVSAAVLGVWLNSRQSEYQDFRSHLLELAQEASVSIDPILHEQIRRPDQTNGPEYRRAVAPLREIRKAVPTIRYLYTVVRAGGRIHFVLDAADPAAKTLRGEAEQSGVWDIYDYPSVAIARALGDGNGVGIAIATEEIVTDEWGSFMTALAPIRDSRGRQIGAVGLDVDATVLSEHLRTLRNRALLGLAPAGALIAMCGLLFFRVRLRGLADAHAALESSAALIQAAQADRLTGLPNRTVFMEHLEAALGRVRDGSQLGCAVLFFDFDRFKLVNDALGHKAGDELLRQIAARLRDALRTGHLYAPELESNVVSRFGGDEFLVLINNLRSAGDAVRVAERLLNALAPGYSILGHEVSSMASVGIVTSDQCRGNAEEVVRKADFAMYEAKRAGRGCSVLFSEAMHARMARHLAIETSLRRAIGTEEIWLAYAPIVDLQTGRRCCAEAQLYWTHPTLGSIAPQELLPIAEESGLMVALGQWILERACLTLARWLREGGESAPDRIHLSISRSELTSVDRFIEHVRSTLQSCALPAECVQIDVSERDLMQNTDKVRSLLLQLQDLGVRSGLRDFGAGHCSLAALREFPFDAIKMDRSFSENLRNDRAGLAVVGATLMLIRNLGRQSVAVGIEDSAQLAVLQSLGCDCGQGPLFADAIPSGSVLEPTEHIAEGPQTRLRSTGTSAAAFNVDAVAGIGISATGHESPQCAID